MKVSRAQASKADPRLASALRTADGDEVLRTVMLLAPNGESDVDAPSLPAVPPGTSRTQYRQHLIVERELRLQRYLAAVLDELRALSLSTKGGKTSRAVVVEGSARQILSSLDLPGVRHASLDQPLGLAD